MAKAFASKIVNLSRFTGQLRKMSAAGRGQTLSRAAQAGALVGETYAKLGAPVDLANLQNAISTRVEESSDTRAVASFGPRNVIYAAIHEFGGIIRAVRANFLTFQTKDGAWHKTKSVNIPARPYMRPAVDQHQTEMEEAVAVTLQREIEEAGNSA